jgi:hypothetical protein
MGNSPQAGGQAPSQGQTGQAPAGQSGGQQEQSLGTQILGQAPKPEEKKAEGTQSAQLLPGQQQGETLEAYVARQQSELERARADAGKYRTELRKYQGDDAKDAEGLTEFQRLQRQFETLNKDLTTERQARKADRMQAQLVSALASAGAADPALTRGLLQIDEAHIGEDGTVAEAAVNAAIAQLQLKLPQLFTDRRGNGDGPAGGGELGGTDPNDINRQIRQRLGVQR